MTSSDHPSMQPRPWAASTLAAALLASLAGCGGGSVADVLLGDPFGCIGSCKESTLIATSALSPDYVATSDGQRTVIRAGLRTSGGTNHDVQLNNEKLYVQLDGEQRYEMRDDDRRVEWSAEAQGGNGGRRFRIDFERLSGNTHSATITMPQAFDLTAPGGTPTITNSSQPLAVNVSAPATERLQTWLAADCGPSFDRIGPRQVSLLAPTASGGGSVYTLDAGSVISFVRPATGPAPTRCAITLTLRRELKGTFDASFRSDANVTGRFDRLLVIQYDAV